MVRKSFDLFSAVAILFFLCVLVYGDILSHQFMIDERIFVDPSVYSFNHERIYLDPGHTIYTLYKAPADYFTRSMGHHYAPFYFFLNIHLFKLFHSPFPFYLINLALFYVNCVLVFYLIYLISDNLTVSLLTGILFCIHPMSGDMLQHINCNILFIQSILMLSGLIALYRYAQKDGGSAYYIFSIVIVFLGLFCHEIIILFPLYAAALLLFLTDLGFKRIFRIIFPYILLVLSLLVIWFVIVNPHVSFVAAKAADPRYFWYSMANFSRLFFWYIGNLFIPKDIVFMANLPPLNGNAWPWCLYLLGFLAFCASLIFCFFKKSLESFAIATFLIGFIFAVPCSQARLQDGSGWVFEPNWIYFSSIGFYLFTALVLLKVREHAGNILFTCLIAGLVFFYCSSTIKHNIMSRTERSYAELWLREFPDNPVAAKIVTTFYCDHPDIEIPSDLIPDMADQAGEYLKDNEGSTPQLIKRLLSSKTGTQQRKDLLFKLTAYYCKNGREIECEGLIHGIIGLKRTSFSYIELSNQLYDLGSKETAIRLLKQCIILYPGYKESYLLIGVILANEGYYQESISYWQQGLMIDPADRRFILNINEAKSLMGKYHRS